MTTFEEFKIKYIHSNKKQLEKLTPQQKIDKINDADRQTTSFIDNSIEAGILLGGNGAFTPWGSLSLSRARSLYDLV